MEGIKGEGTPLKVTMSSIFNVLLLNLIVWFLVFPAPSKYISASSIVKSDVEC